MITIRIQEWNIKKRTNLLDSSPNQSSKFCTKILVEKTDDARGTYNTNIQIKSKTAILKSSLYDYNDAYIFVKGTITVTRVAVAANEAVKWLDARNNGVIFKNI